MNAEADTCKEHLEQFMRRDLAGWMGLSGQCAEHDVARWLPLREGEGVARLGSDMIEYRFRVTEAGGYAEPVRLMFHDAALCLVRTGLLSTKRTECQRLLHDLGDPPIDSISFSGRASSAMASGCTPPVG